MAFMLSYLCAEVITELKKQTPQTLVQVQMKTISLQVSPFDKELIMGFCSKLIKMAQLPQM